MGRAVSVYDCPAEKEERYAAARPSKNRPPSPWVLGQFAAGEIDIPSGLGAVNVHWQSGGAPPPFGRPAGYENNLCRASAIEQPSQLILFGDGHSDVFGVWPQDRWWIWKEIGNANGPGFNRVAQGDKGAVRHNRKSNTPWPTAAPGCWTPRASRATPTPAGGRSRPTRTEVRP